MSPVHPDEYLAFGIAAKREALAAAIEATKQAHDNYMLLAAQEIRLRRELEDLLS
jgi:hypothetical protein